ncbi:MAG: amino acid ABC transporter ATP-binding protein [Pseudobacteriovorax sp.]|nr:amino acid ABC transporter ATP-binding protein [Pseudobacteriovorax sp.]
MTPLINMESVSKSFATKTKVIEVLKSVSLEVQEGEIVCLIGPSGGGKSTLLRSINALEPINSGSITVCGQNLNQSAGAVQRVRRETGMIFQRFELFPHLSALENVAIGLVQVNKLSRSDADSRARELLQDVGLADHVNKYPANLSGGQQQRVAIARALATDPKILLCDEPTSALDPELVDEVTEILGKVAASGMTMLIVTHEMRFARQIADRVLFLDQGTIAEQGTAEDIFKAPKSERLKQFLKQIHF